MKSPSRLLSFSFLALSLVGAAHATSEVINFETTPNLPQGPSTYQAAGPMQTITDPGFATITGGVVLGDATFFPAIVYASAPNVYGTASPGVAQADPSLSSTIDIAIDPAYSVNEVSMWLFNGNTYPVDYTVSAYSGSTLLGSQSFGAIPSNLNLGYVTPDLQYSGITDVKVSVNNPSAGWDFLIDDVTLNGKVNGNPFPTPEPASMIALAAGAAALIRRKSARR